MSVFAILFDSRKSKMRTSRTASFQREIVPMRVTQNVQMTIGEVDISKMRFDLKSRDDIPKILRGLQFIYTDLALRASIFALLNVNISPKVSKTNGRPGMSLWSILVCGVIRLDLNCDYDRLHELVNHHNTLREMLGHGAFDDLSYHFQTLKDLRQPAHPGTARPDQPTRRRSRPRTGKKKSRRSPAWALRLLCT